MEKLEGKNSLDIEKGRYTLKDNVTGETIELDGTTPTLGLPGIDIKPLRAQFKREAVDPGFTSTAMGASAVTYIDGNKGVLLHRGYAIEDLAENCSFMETAHLILEGELPTPQELKAFEGEMIKMSAVSVDAEELIYTRISEGNYDPMNVLNAALNRQITEDDDPRKAAALIPMMVATIIRAEKGLPTVDSTAVNENASYMENFVAIAFSENVKDAEIDPAVLDILEKMMIVHIDHEQNASTTSARGTRSASSTMAQAMVSGIATLAGPSHGGANRDVAAQFDKIYNDPEGGTAKEKVARFMAQFDEDRAAGKSPRIMGVGHRVYKNTDPRAGVIAEAIPGVLKSLGVEEDPILEVAQELEKAVREHPYLQEKQTYPNVDFYSGFVYKALGLEQATFTNMFAAGRGFGWLAQAEEHDRDGYPIARPRQQYVGKTERPVVPIANREAIGDNGGPGIDEMK